MKEEEYIELRKKARELRITSNEQAEAILRDAFEATQKILLAVGGLLEEHYSFTGNLSGQEWHRRLGTYLCPNEPLAWTTLTEFLIFTKKISKKPMTPRKSP